MRVFWFLVGVTALLLGLVGVVLPLLPTVPFILLAAFAFARSSPVLHRWLMNHRTFGRMIRDWQENGAIRRQVKIVASGSIVGVFGLSVVLGVNFTVLAVQFIVLTGVALFIWTRPE